jgi:hypothetical protein
MPSYIANEQEKANKQFETQDWAEQLKKWKQNTGEQ